MLRESAAGDVRSVLNIGHYLSSQLFRASEEAFRSKDPTKPDSLRDLAAQPRMAEAKWNRTRLDNSVELALMAKTHNDFRAWRFLRTSHYVVVIGTPTDKQRELLDRAEKEGWSVKSLRQEAGKQKPRASKAAGPVSPAKALLRVRKLAKQLGPLADSATVVDCVLVPSGIEPKDAAEFTAAMKKALEKGFRRQLEEMKKKSAAKLKRVAGRVSGPK